MAELQEDWRNVVQMLNNYELIKRYRSGQANIMFVVLIRDELTSHTWGKKALSPENHKDNLANGQKQQWRLRAVDPPSASITVSSQPLVSTAYLISSEHPQLAGS